MLQLQLIPDFFNKIIKISKHTYVYGFPYATYSNKITLT